MDLNRNFDINTHIEAYKMIFDIVRIVDPINKTVSNYKIDPSAKDSVFCYSIWKDNKQCKECISYKAFIQNKPFIKLQYNEDKLYLMYAIPIMVNNNRLVLELLNDVTDHLAFETVSEDGGHSLRNADQDIKNLILRDSLTGLYNKRYIEQKLPHEISLCSEKNPLSIAMLDLDHFKKINDTYGHNVGDQFLEKIGIILSKVIRIERDWVARYGGEEFLICLPGTDNKSAFKVLERVRKAIEKMYIKVGEEKVNVTVSLGLYTINNKDISSSALIQYADEKLYQAKQQGRNRVVS